MRAYIKIIMKLIDSQLEDFEKFRLIKLDSFSDPLLYRIVCSKLDDILQGRNIDLIAKLSKEKYEFMKTQDKHALELEEMDNRGWIEKKENLTKWRNENFNDNSDKSNVILLMGTELVEDKGGLEDFYTISPESIEVTIGTNYAKLFVEHGLNLNEDDQITINNTYENIFKHVQKDMFKLSNFISDSIEPSCSSIDEIITIIYSNLYEWWGIANIFEILGFQNLEKLSDGKISIIEKAYKFTRRISTGASTDNALGKYIDKIDKYYDTYKSDIKHDFDKYFSPYSSFSDMKNDLIDYLKGVHLETNINSLSKCNYIEINKMINMKIETESTGKSKITKVSGGPLDAFALTTLELLNELDQDEKTTVDQVNVRIDGIKLSGVVKDYFEDYKDKWTKMCRFLNGIDYFLNKTNMENSNSDSISFSIHSKNHNDELVNPFEYSNFDDLITSKVISNNSAASKNTKIKYRIELLEKKSNRVRFCDYEWNISDYDTWISAFDILDSSELRLNNTLDEMEAWIPIGVSEDMDALFDTTNPEDYLATVTSMNIKYTDICPKMNFDPFNKDYQIETSSHKLGTSFVSLLRSIASSGFFGLLKDIDSCNTMNNFITSYELTLKTIKDSLPNLKKEELINKLSNSFVILNNDRINSKGITGALISAFHPLMLDKLMARYLFMSEGIIEISKSIFESDDTGKKMIKDMFNRFDQLGTITFATGALLNEYGQFTSCKKTEGFNSLYGNKSSKYSFYSSSNNDSDVNDDSKMGSLENTPVSKYITKTIIDHIKIYPSKLDGLRIAFYRPEKYSDIIVALKNSFSLLKKMKIPQFKVELIIYSSDYRCKDYNYLKKWIDNNITEDDDVEVYAKIKYLDSEENTKITYFEKNILDSDIAFFGNIMAEKEIRTEEAEDAKPKGDIETRYPAIYLPIPNSNEDLRKLSISQTQFHCEMVFTQFLSKYRDYNIRNTFYRLVKVNHVRKGLENVISVMHDRNSWVVILDENVDPYLIQNNKNHIIGYSTGEGYFGELNATISSKNDYIKDLRNFLDTRLIERFPGWNKNERNTASENCLDFTDQLDGSEVLKAINPNDQAINNYLAFVLTSRIESFIVNGTPLYHNLISTDTYSHLFNTEISIISTSNSRPDFMLVELPSQNFSDDFVEINIKIIECKMGHALENRVDEAISQLNYGYEKITSIWADGNTVQKRFWRNQLFKILSINKNSDMNDGQLTDYTNHLLKINEGKYRVNFSLALYAFNLDVEEDKTEIIKDNDLEINHVSFGTKSIKNMLVDNQYSLIDIEESKVGFEFSKGGHHSKNENESREYDDYSKVAESAQVYQVADNGNHEAPISNINQEANTSSSSVNREHEVGRNNAASVFEQESNKDSTSVEHKNDDNKDVSNSTNDKNMDVSNVNSSNKDVRLMSDSKVTSLFKAYGNTDNEEEIESINTRLETLRKELLLRKIKVHIGKKTIGPDIIRTELELGVGVNIDQVRKNQEDMKLWLNVNEKPFIFIENGKVNIDIVRKSRQVVGLKDVIEKLENQHILDSVEDNFYCLLGVDILGQPHYVNFNDSNTPHLLIAGQTGSGKSVLLNSMLISIMLMYTPDEVEMILVDPKYIELTSFIDSPFTKVVATEVEETSKLLDELVIEMNDRYKKFMGLKAKNITSYNKKCEDNQKMKRIIMVFDEYAAMMEENAETAKFLESSIKVLSQKARAAGIHLIICTQSPRADIITTTIRNNLTARVALRVADSNASGLILDGKGAESLLGKGDMWFKTGASSAMTRLKSPYVTEEELEVFIEVLEGE